jgi:protein TonB
VSIAVQNASAELMIYVPSPRASRFNVPLLASVALHVVALLVFAGTSVRLVAPPTAPIRVTIIDPAPPPPLGNAAAPVAAVVIPQPAPQPHPVARPRPRIARQPHPIADTAATTEPAPSIDETARGPSDSNGVVDGAPGGSVGGQPGGSVGGHGDQVWRADEVASPPIAIAKPMPNYPPLARARGIEGLVVLEAIVDRSGQIEPDGVKVLQSVAQLDEAAISAFRQWRFKPGRDQHGEPVRVVLEVPIRFHLR